MGITEEQKAYLIGKRYENEKKMRGQHEGNQHTKMEYGENRHIPNRENTTRSKLAKEYGVGEFTIRSNADYSKGIDILPESIKHEVLTGQLKESKEDIKQIVPI